MLINQKFYINNDTLKKYKHQISFYDNIPDYEVTEDEFEEIAEKRIKILNKIYSQEELSINDNNEDVLQCIKENLPLDDESENIISIEEIIKQRQIDNLSHYLLLLLCCNSREMKYWLIKTEIKLFIIRFNQLSLTNKREFIKDLKINLSTADPIEYEEYKEYYNYPKILFKVNNRILLLIYYIIIIIKIIEILHFLNKIIYFIK